MCINSWVGWFPQCAVESSWNTEKAMARMVFIEFRFNILKKEWMREEKRIRGCDTESKSPKKLPRPIHLVRVVFFGLSLSGSKIGGLLRPFPESITLKCNLRRNWMQSQFDFPYNSPKRPAYCLESFQEIWNLSHAKHGINFMIIINIANKSFQRWFFNMDGLNARVQMWGVGWILRFIFNMEKKWVCILGYQYSQRE